MTSRASSANRASSEDQKGRRPAGTAKISPAKSMTPMKASARRRVAALRSSAPATEPAAFPLNVKAQLEDLLTRLGVMSSCSMDEGALRGAAGPAGAGPAAQDLSNQSGPMGCGGARPQ